MHMPGDRRDVEPADEDSAAFSAFMAFVLFAIAGVIAQGTFFSGRAQTGVSMPTVFPSVLIMLMTGLGGALAIQAWRGIARCNASVDFSVADFWEEHARAVIVFALTIAFVAFMPVLGFLPASFLVVAAISVTIGERRPIWLLLFSTAFTAFLYAVFIWMLRVPLPAGWLFAQ